MPTKKPIHFSQAYQELEEITEWFERGEADLEAGLKKFERALELAAACKAQLAEAENKVAEIKKKFEE